MRIVRRCLFLILTMLLASCQSLPTPPTPPTPQPSKPIIKEPKPSAKIGLLTLSTWSEIDSVWQDDLMASWSAWLKSCVALKSKAHWKQVCELAKEVSPNDARSIQTYWIQHFNVYSASKQNGERTGLITGYYQPLLAGSRKPSRRYPYPLYKRPDDLITVNLISLYPELKYKRIRGKLKGNELTPYHSRADIEHEAKPLKGNELVWVEDNIESFFLEIQGSGIIQFENGDQMQVGYADQNGHPYRSVGSLLIQRGELSSSQASMGGIKHWARKNPQKVRELLDSNPSYVFFRELPSDLSGPLGALGVPLTAERSIAVDPKYIPLGAPVYLSTTYPNSNQVLQHLMMAQDTGGAIRDGVRADFYWGAGDSAGKQAGSMKQSGRMWVLLPKEYQF